MMFLLSAENRVFEARETGFLMKNRAGKALTQIREGTSEKGRVPGETAGQKKSPAFLKRGFLNTTQLLRNAFD